MKRNETKRNTTGILSTGYNLSEIPSSIVECGSLEVQCRKVYVTMLRLDLPRIEGMNFTGWTQLNFTNMIIYNAGWITRHIVYKAKVYQRNLLPDTRSIPYKYYELLGYTLNMVLSYIHATIHNSVHLFTFHDKLMITNITQHIHRSGTIKLSRGKIIWNETVVINATTCADL